LAVLSVDEIALLCGDMFSLSRWLETGLLAYAQAQLVSTFSLESNNTSSSSSSSSVVHATLTTAAASLFSVLRKSMLPKIAQLLLQDCRRHLAAVKVIAAKYRMTNKPPPDAQSSYVDVVNSPIKNFRDRFGEVLQLVCSGSSGLEAWYFDLLEEVTLSFLQQVQQLVDTVRQMDNALQRRSKIAQPSSFAASGSANMTDSEKISMQVQLDVLAFGADVSGLGVISSVNDLPSYKVLLTMIGK
jgi:hypothetical protein